VKKTTTIAALSVVALLSAAPLLVSADDDYWEEKRDENRRDGAPMNADRKQYSTEEMRIMAYGQALRRFGPGVEVSVNKTKDDIFQVQLRDAEQNLIREQEFDQYGARVYGSSQD